MYFFSISFLKIHLTSAKISYPDASVISKDSRMQDFVVLLFSSYTSDVPYNHNFGNVESGKAIAKNEWISGVFTLTAEFS